MLRVMVPSKSELLEIYSLGKSMAEIASIYKISVHKVAYWMNKYEITKRSRSEAGYLKHNPAGDPFFIVQNPQNKILQALAIGLFLGEGTKKQIYSVRFTNSDPQLIRIFLNFLKTICNVKKEKIRCWINLFDDYLYEESLKYWINQTNLECINFYKPIIRAQKIGTYKNKSKYGTITVIVSNTKLLKIIKQFCKQYINTYADMAQW